MGPDVELKLLVDLTIQENLIKYYQAMKDLKMVFDKVGVPFWIDYGTLLSAIRDGVPITWDLTDIDISIKLKNWNIAISKSINEEFNKLGWAGNSWTAEHGYRLVFEPNDYVFQLCYYKEKISIDIWIFHEKDNFYYKTWSHKNGEYMYSVVPKKYYDGIEHQVMYCDCAFSIPNYVEDYLSLVYTVNWKIPATDINVGNKMLVRKGIMYRRWIDFLDGRYDEQRYLKEVYPWDIKEGNSNV